MLTALWWIEVRNSKLEYKWSRSQAPKPEKRSSTMEPLLTAS